MRYILPYQTKQCQTKVTRFFEDDENVVQESLQAVLQVSDEIFRKWWKCCPKSTSGCFYRTKWTKFVKVLGNLSEIVLSDKVCLLNSRYSNIISHLASTME